MEPIESMLILLLVALLAAMSLRPVRQQVLRLPAVVWMGAGLTLYLCTLPALCDTLVYFIEHRYAAIQDIAIPTNGRLLVLVLPGGGLRARVEDQEIRMGAQTWERLSAGISVFSQAHASHPATFLVLPGGKLAPDASGTMGGLMAGLAVRMGVPPEQMLVEQASLDTHENIAYSVRAFNIQSEDQVVLVTSALHMPRAVAVARKLGLNALPYPCDYWADESTGWKRWIPELRASAKLKAALHELLGLLYYRIKGWAA